MTADQILQFIENNFSEISQGGFSEISFKAIENAKAEKIHLIHLFAQLISSISF